jgi:hypothetical protein
MPVDEESGKKKLDEISAVFSQDLPPVESAPAVKAALREYIRITPPERDDLLYHITVHQGGWGGGRSMKPGNIRLNMRQLITALANGTLAAVGAFQVPWTAVLGALVVWDGLYSAASVDLSERDASVMWTLWISCDDNRTVSSQGLLQLVNAERDRCGRVLLSDMELQDALERLKKMRSIERWSKDPSRWWLREWVSVQWR